jgi:hypothetical protein
MVALPNIAEFLLKEGKFVQDVFAVFQSNDGGMIFTEITMNPLYCFYYIFFGFLCIIFEGLIFL